MKFTRLYSSLRPALCLAPIALACLHTPVHAVPITYTFSGRANATITSVGVLENVPYLFTFVSDTTTITLTPPDTFFAVFAPGATFTIGGNNGTSLSLGYVFVNQSFGGIGWGYDDTSDAGGGFFASAAAYTLNTELAEDATTPYTPNQSFNSNLGDVLLTPITARFTATLGNNAAPEPGTLALLAFGTLGGLLARRKK
jgi:hypothetical protein